jgi:mono/diheme cytochrome c family protein
MLAGEAIFVDTCSAFHTRAGTGIEHLLPKLSGNVVTTQDGPASFIRIIIAGGRAAATDARPTSPAIPSLGYRLSDEQIAAVVTFVRNNWGKAASRVSADTVRDLRNRVTGSAE